jgi:acyl-CoA thioesterase-1
MADLRHTDISRRAMLGAGPALASVLAAPGLAWAKHGQVVTILGDSITAGYGLQQKDSLPIQLQAALKKLGVDTIVRGAGVSGDTSADGLGRLDFSIRPDTAVVVVALGGNDLLQGIDPKTTQANLDAIVTRLKARRMGIVLTGLHAPPELGRNYARDFNAVFPAVAKAHGVVLYPDLLAGVARNPALNQGDAIHPNAQGALIVATGLAPLVAKALRARP